MKTTAYAFVLAGSLLFGSNFDIGVSGSDGKIDGFSLSIGDYYRVPQQEVIVVERRIPREEVGVAYYLARLHTGMLDLSLICVCEGRVGGT